MYNTIKIPVEQAIIDWEYNWAYRYENGQTIMRGPRVTYKGNGVGWIFNNPNNIIENITELERYMTWEEEKEYNRINFEKEENKKTNELNILGLFNNCYIQGEHEMYNGWVSYDFYEMCKNLNEEHWILIGVAQPPWDWNIDDPCVAMIIEDIDGDKFWCHAHKSWVDDMRNCMRTEYEKILEKGEDTNGKFS